MPGFIQDRFRLGWGRMVRRKMLNLWSTDAVNAWLSKYAGTFTRASTMMVQDAGGVFRETPINEPAIYGGEWDAENSKWLNAAGAGMAFWPSVTNALAAGKYRDFQAWDIVTASISKNIVGIDGVVNSASTATDNSASVTQQVSKTESISADTSWHSASIFIKKDTDETRFPRLFFGLFGGSELVEAIRLNTKTGDVYEDSTDGVYGVIDCGIFWYVWYAIQNDGTNTSAKLYYYPSAVATIDGAINVSVTGSIGVDWAQIFIGQRRPCPFPIPGGDTLAAQTFSFENSRLISDDMGAVYAEYQAFPDWGGHIINARILDDTLIYANAAVSARTYDQTNSLNVGSGSNDSVKAAVSWVGGVQFVCADGDSAVGDYDGSVNISSQLYVGNKYSGGYSFPGIISKIIFDYKTPRNQPYWELMTS